jgi:hypothetical protein
MIPIHVALVRYHTDDNVDRGTFLRVAAALQVQLTRDFTPIWGIPAVVSAFESLEDVSPACIPLLIVKPGTLDPRFHGFHVTEGDQSIGLVEARRDWSLAASHELLEIACDPAGERKVPGESLRDSADPGELTPLADRYRSLQGQVSYLVEVCDPCQSDEFAYTVDGVLVSDFVTPRYYDPQRKGSGSYSFTGAVTEPLQVLEGGYVSWYTSLKGAPIWQANRDNDGNLTVGPLAIPAPDFSRHRVDRFTDHVGDRKRAARVKDRKKKEDLARKSAKRYGEELKDEVSKLLAAYEAERKHKPVPLEELLPTLKKLATNKKYYQTFQADPNSLFAEDALKGLLPPGSFFRGGRYPDQEEFKTAYAWAKNHVGSSMDPVGGLVATTMIKGDTIGGP